MFIVLKALISSLFIILVTTIAKKTSLIGGLIAMMPVNTVLSLLWLHFEKADTFLLINFIRSAILGTLPTLFFLVAVFIILNKFQKLEYSLAAGACILFVFALLQYKILKVIF